jgi:hypothetical protein
MGHAGKAEEQLRARELRAEAWTLQEIADELDVSKSSASLWCRDVEFTPQPRNRGHSGHKPHPLHVKKLEEIERCRLEAEEIVGALSERDLLIYGLALYLGEGAKTEDSGFGLANTSAAVMVSFVAWMRQFFEIDEGRLRVRLYLHEGLDIDAATQYWSTLLRIPPDQFTRPYRPQPRASGEFRKSKYQYGCATVRYSDVTVHRRVMAMIDALTSRFVIPG